MLVWGRAMGWGFHIFSIAVFRQLDCQLMPIGATRGGAFPATSSRSACRPAPLNAPGTRMAYVGVEAPVARQTPADRAGKDMPHLATALRDLGRVASSSFKRLNATAMQKAPFRVLFCGQDMPSAFQLTRQALEGSGVEVVNCAREETLEAIRNADVAIPLMTPLGRREMVEASRLKLILQFGVGLERVDISAATERGVWVSNVPSQFTGNARSCAEHAMYLALACLRDGRAMDKALRQGRVGQPAGRTLFGRTALVLGFGGIAQELIPRLHAFGSEVLCLRKGEWSDPNSVLPSKRASENTAEDSASAPSSLFHHALSPSGLQRTAALAQSLLSEDAKGEWDRDMHLFAGRADVVFVAVAETPATRGLVNRSFVQALKPGAVLVNVSRGGLLDREAIAEGLESGHIGGLGLDVFWEEPLNMEDPVAAHPRTILTPHVAGVTDHSYTTMAAYVAEQVLRCQTGLEPLRTVVAGDL